MRVVSAADADAVDETVAVLAGGGMALVPTDTVYGLAVQPGNPESVERVFAAKGRPVERNLPVLASTIEQVQALGVEVGEVSQALARKWWPGALTIVLGFAPDAARPDWLATRDEVAVRLPDIDFLRRVMDRAGVLLVTSANAHGAPTPPDAMAAARSLVHPPDIVADAGPLEGTPSTLVNVAVSPPRVERAGPLPPDELSALGIAGPESSDRPAG